MDLDTLIERLPAIRRMFTGVHPAVWFAALVAVYLAWPYRRPAASWLGRTFPIALALLGAIKRGIEYLAGALIAAVVFIVMLPFRLLMPGLTVLAGWLDRFDNWLVGAASGAGDGVAGVSVGIGPVARTLWTAWTSSALAGALAAFGRAIASVPPRAVWLVVMVLRAAGRLLRAIARRLEMLARGLTHFASARVLPPLRALLSLGVRVVLLPLRFAHYVVALLARALARLMALVIGAAASAWNRAAAVLRRMSGSALSWLRSIVSVALPMAALPFRLAARGLALMGSLLGRLNAWMVNAAERAGSRGIVWIRRLSKNLVGGLTLLGGGLGLLDAWLIDGAERAGDRAADVVRRLLARAAVPLGRAGRAVRILATSVATSVFNALWRAARSAGGRLVSVWGHVLLALRRSFHLGLRGLMILGRWLGRLGTWMTNGIKRTGDRAASAVQRASEYLAGVLNTVLGFVVLSPLRLAVRGLTFIAGRLARFAATAGGAIGRALARAAAAIGMALRMALRPLMAALFRALRYIGSAIARTAVRSAQWLRTVWTAFASSKLVGTAAATVRGAAGAVARGAAFGLVGAGLLFGSAVDGLVLAAQTGLQGIGLVAGAVLVPLRAVPAWHARLGPRTRLAMNGLLAGGALVALWYVLLPPWPTLRIAAGTGHASFEPILRKWAAANRVNLEMTYKGSLDIMLMLKSGDFPYDAIWEADSLWTSLSGSRDIKNTRSIMCSPIVFGVKRELARDLGWIGKQDLPMRDLLAAMESRQLKVLQTSATQSNSGASAYFGFLYAFAGQPDVLTVELLQDPAVQAQTKRVLATISRTSESSGWLRDLYVSEYPQYDAMFNYESHIIEANQKLVRAGKEPLYVLYLREGLGIADFPFSFVSRGNVEIEPHFNALQQYLLSDGAQSAIAAKGRRVGPLCNQMDPVPADWGVDPERTVNAIRYPVASVIWDALHLYQASLRKPSYTVYALDFSASMEGEGKRQLLQAMRTVLDTEGAKRYLLEASSDDVNSVLLFNHAVMNGRDVANWTVGGNHPGDLERLLGQIGGARPSGRTDIYQPVVRALEEMQARGVGARLPAIILMTDGESNTGSLADIEQKIASTGLRNVPIYGITFGDASAAQLEAIAKLTRGRVYDGSKDLISAIKSAKANN